MPKKPTVTDGLRTLFADYDVRAPRFEVFVGPADSMTPTDGQPKDVDSRLASERRRIEDRIFRATSDADRPSATQLVPLAGPWGDGPSQRTNDVRSIELSEKLAPEAALGEVRVQVHNVYDPVAQRFRYTDAPRGGGADATPILDAGKSLVLRMGYANRCEVVFDGIIEEVSIDFPADGEPTCSVRAVDKRGRLRAVHPAMRTFRDKSVEEIAATLIADAGLVLGRQTSEQSTRAGRRVALPRDTDLCRFVTDQAVAASLELGCFGNLLTMLPPAEDADHAISYRYRQGLIAFRPTFSAVAVPLRVEVHARTPDRERLVGRASRRELALDRFITSGEEDLSVLSAGEGSDEENRVLRISDVVVDDQAEANRRALAALKQRADRVFTAEGDLLGDPRVRPGKTLRVDGVGRYSGLYYVTSTTHSYGEGGYTTRFSARRSTRPAEPAAEPQEGAES